MLYLILESCMDSLILRSKGRCTHRESFGVNKGIVLYEHSMETMLSWGWTLKQWCPYENIFIDIPCNAFNGLSRSAQSAQSRSKNTRKESTRKQSKPPKSSRRWGCAKYAAKQHNTFTAFLLQWYTINRILGVLIVFSKICFCHLAVRPYIDCFKL